MPRYVDADKVLKAFCDTCASKKADWFCESLCKIKEKINSVPTEAVKKINEECKRSEEE